VALFSLKPYLEVLAACYNLENTEIKLTLICGVFSWMLSYSLSGNLGNTILDVDLQGGYNQAITSLNLMLTQKGYIQDGTGIEIPYMVFRIVFCFFISFFGSLSYVSARRRVRTHTHMREANFCSFKLFSVISFSFSYIVLLTWVRPLNNILQDSLPHPQLWWFFRQIMRPFLPLFLLSIQLLLLRSRVQSYLVAPYEFLTFVLNARQIKDKGSHIQVHINQTLLFVPAVAIELVATSVFVAWVSFVGSWWSSFVVVILILVEGAMEVVVWVGSFLPGLEEKLSRKMMVKKEKPKKNTKEKKK